MAMVSWGTITIRGTMAIKGTVAIRGVIRGAIRRTMTMVIL